MYRTAGRVLIGGLLASLVWTVASLPGSGYVDAVFPLLLALTMCLSSHKSLQDTFWLRRAPTGSVMAAISLGFMIAGLAISVQFAVDSATRGALSRFLESLPSPALPPSPVLALLVAAFVLPALEELLFRGFMLSSFDPETFGIGGQVWIPALIFALMHPLIAVPSVLAISLFASQAVVGSRSILPALAIHMANNFVGEVFDQTYYVNRYAGLSVGLAAMLLGAILAYAWTDDFRRLCAAARQSSSDLVAGGGGVFRKLLGEWTYVVLGVIIVLKFVAFFLPVK